MANYTDQLLVLSSGIPTQMSSTDTIEISSAFTAAGITGTSLTDGTLSITGGAISSAVSLTASGAVTGGSLTDGTATLTAGTLSGGVAATFSGAVTGGSLTDGTATLASGTLTAGVAATFSGAITGGSLTDGTATITSGALTGGATAVFSSSVQAGSFTDQQMTISAGSMTGAIGITASGTVQAGTLAVTGDAGIAGDLVVNGDIVSRGSVNLVVADPIIDLGFGNSTATSNNPGLSLMMNRASSFTALTTSSFTAGIAATSAPLITFSSASTLSADDIIAVSGADDAANDGLYVVESVTATDAVLYGIGGTAVPAYVPFCQNQVATASGDTSAQVYKVDLAVMLASDGSSLVDGSTAITKGTLAWCYAASATLSGFGGGGGGQYASVQTGSDSTPTLQSVALAGGASSATVSLFTSASFSHAGTGTFAHSATGTVAFAGSSFDVDCTAKMTLDPAAGLAIGGDSTTKGVQFKLVGSDTTESDEAERGFLVNVTAADSAAAKVDILATAFDAGASATELGTVEIHGNVVTLGTSSTSGGKASVPGIRVMRDSTSGGDYMVLGGSNTFVDSVYSPHAVQAFSYSGGTDAAAAGLLAGLVCGFHDDSGTLTLGIADPRTSGTPVNPIGVMANALDGTNSIAYWSGSAGQSWVQMDSSPSAVNVGAKVYLANDGSGKGTLTAPSTAGDDIWLIGLLIDSTSVSLPGSQDGYRIASQGSPSFVGHVN